MRNKIHKYRNEKGFQFAEIYWANLLVFERKPKRISIEFPCGQGYIIGETTNLLMKSIKYSLIYLYLFSFSFCPSINEELLVDIVY